MAILAFQKPDKVLMLEADNKFGKFEFKPLEPGYGITIGNALRRILLSSLEGYAISSIKIDGVKHEFDTIPGVMEDVTNIILNLKKVDLKQVVEDTDAEKAVVNVSGVEVLTAGDLGKVLTGFEVLNPDLVICHLDSAASFTLEFTINKGRGWVPAEENVVPDDDVNVIAIDSIYTPIKNVKYTVDNFRVDQKTDYDKLTLEITTNGSILPKDALKEAAKILIYHFMLFSDEKITLESSEQEEMRNSMKKCSTCASSSNRSSSTWISQSAPSTASKALKWKPLESSLCSTATTSSNSATSVRNRSLSSTTCWPTSTSRSGWIFQNTN